MVVGVRIPRYRRRPRATADHRQRAPPAGGKDCGAEDDVGRRDPQFLGAAACREARSGAGPRDLYQDHPRCRSGRRRNSRSMRRVLLAVPRRHANARVPPDRVRFRRMGRRRDATGEHPDRRFGCIGIRDIQGDLRRLSPGRGGRAGRDGSGRRYRAGPGPHPLRFTFDTGCQGRIQHRGALGGVDRQPERGQADGAGVERL